MRGAPFCKVDFAMTGGYGYMDPVFYPQLFLYIPALMVVFGASVSCAYRMFMVIINIATVLISYYCFGKISKNKIAALFCTAIYTLNHYRLRDCIMRGALGEVLFICFIPVVIYSIYCIFNSETDKWPLLMIGATCIFQSHIIGALLTAVGGAVFIAVYFIKTVVSGRKLKEPVIALIKAGTGTVFLNIWYLVPMLYYYVQDFEMFSGDSFYKYIYYSNTLKGILLDYTFDYESRYWLYSRTGLLFAVIFVVLLSLIVYNSIREKRIRDETLIIFLSIIFLITASSYLPWEKIAQIGIIEKFMSTVQFAFRMITLFIIFVIVALAMFLKNKVNKRSRLIIGVLSILTVISGACYYIVENQTFNGYDGEFWFSTVPPEYFMTETKHGEVTRREKYRTYTDDVVVLKDDNIAAGKKVIVENKSATDNWIEIPLYYYDGYCAYSEKEQMYLPVQFGENGVIRIIIPPQVTGTINIQYNSKGIFHIAELVSTITAIFMIVYFTKIKSKRRAGTV